jgi:hypothetical protein
MKLSLAQIILGAFIIVAACYVTGWMIHKAPSELRQPNLDAAATQKYIDVVPEHNGLFNVARYGSYLLPVIGIYLLVSGAIENVKTGARNRNWLITDIVAGLVVAALGFIITTWGYPTTFHEVVPENSELMKIIFTNPGRTLVAVQTISGILVLLGLAVLGVSIAQLVKSRKTINT